MKSEKDKLTGEFCEVYDLVKEKTKWNHDKLWTWFKEENPLLGNASPLEMILFGRTEKLKQFIEDMTS